MSITEKDLRDHFRMKFQDLQKSINGNPGSEFVEVRQKAIDEFSHLGFPLGKNEEYKYTPLTRALLKSIDLNPEQPSSISMVPPFGEHLISGLDGYVLVYWNGRLVYQPDDLPKELSIQQFDSLNHNSQVELSKLLATLTNNKGDAFAALNTALFEHGSVITIAEHCKLDQPIVIYHLSDGLNGATYSQARHLIVVEAGAQMQLVEINKNLSPEHQFFQNTVTEIFVKQQAQLHYNKVQTQCNGGILVDNTNIIQENESRLFCNTITTSGDVVRNNLNITVNGSNCESNMNGLYLVDGKDHVDNHTMVDHRIANSYSNELYKGIIDGSATGVFNGKIYVQPNAQKTNAFQSNKNILLSDKASMNTKPQLEIWADDVKCSHGATIGQLDEEQVFYLRARGLDEQQARGLLLYAFATEFLEQVSIPVLKDYLETVIADRLYHQES